MNCMLSLFRVQEHFFKLFVFFVVSLNITYSLILFLRMDIEFSSDFSKEAASGLVSDIHNRKVNLVLSQKTISNEAPLLFDWHDLDIELHDFHYPTNLP